MNSYTAVVHLCKDPEALNINGKELMKLRLADGTFGKNAETRFLDALVGGQDAEVAKRLESGDQIIITGCLVLGSYKSKKGKNKGKTVQTDSIPFAKIMQVTKSEKFFAGTEDAGSDDAGDETASDETEADETDDAGPLADIV